MFLRMTILKGGVILFRGPEYDRFICTKCNAVK
jgi:hypothetical protein